MKHEEEYIFPSGFKVRWCERHRKAHGYLYACEYFSPELRERIRRDDRIKVGKLVMSIALVIIFCVMLTMLG